MRQEWHQCFSPLLVAMQIQKDQRKKRAAREHSKVRSNCIFGETPFKISIPLDPRLLWPFLRLILLGFLRLPGSRKRTLTQEKRRARIIIFSFSVNCQEVILRFGCTLQTSVEGVRVPLSQFFCFFSSKEVEILKDKRKDYLWREERTCLRIFKG